jgi:hypothetical protein
MNPVEIRPYTPFKTFTFIGGTYCPLAPQLATMLIISPLSIHTCCSIIFYPISATTFDGCSKGKPFHQHFVLKFSSSKTPTPYMTKVSFEIKSQTSSFVITYSTKRRHSFWFL